jgi:2'-5' RNA ligase
MADSTDQYYVAVEVTKDHHMTLAFLGQCDHDRMEAVIEAIRRLPFPSNFHFGEVMLFGENKDIEVLEVKGEDLSVTKHLTEFHKKFVQPGHISENQFRMHVTTKGCVKQLKALESFTCKSVYIKRLGAEKAAHTFEF